MRLTDKQRAAIVHEFAAGKSKSEIARKFGVSDTAVSKTLQKYKSSESLKKFESSEKVRKTRKEIRSDIIEKAYEALAEKGYDKLSADTLLKIIERLTYLDSVSTDASTPKEELAAIIAQIEKVKNNADG